MTDDDFRAFSELWLATAGLYPGHPPSETTVELAFNALAQYDLVAVRTALSQHMQDPSAGMYAPKPADLVRLIGGSNEDRALMAWSKVERALRAVGQYQSVAFDDPFIHATIADMGSWSDLCRTDEDELPFKRREFAQRYAAYRRRGQVPEFPARLVGADEAHNRAHGFLDRIGAPALVGDEERARKVLERGSEGAGVRITLQPAPVAQALTQHSPE